MSAFVLKIYGNNYQYWRGTQGLINHIFIRNFDNLENKESRTTKWLLFMSIR